MMGAADGRDSLHQNGFYLALSFSISTVSPHSAPRRYPQGAMRRKLLGKGCFMMIRQHFGKPGVYSKKDRGH